MGVEERDPVFWFTKMASSPPILAYWDCRGLAAPIRIMH